MTTRSRFIAICAAFVFVLTGQSMAMARGANDAAGQMVLCVGTTSLTVYIDETGAPTQAPHYCPDCTLTLLDALLADVVAMPVHDVVAGLISTKRIAVIRNGARAVYLSRAPPVVI